MASNAKRRTKEAAERGGGLLSRIGNSRFGRKVVAPAVTAASLASQLQADQSSDRNTGQRTAVTQTTRGSVRPSGLRGTKPNPLPAGLDMSARFAAQQQQDRIAEGTEDTGELAFFEGGDEGTFLEANTRPYSQPEPTDAEVELGKQKEMRRTAKRLLVSGTEETGEARAEGPARRQTSSRDEEVSDASPEERVATSDDEMTEEVIAENLAREQEEDARQQAAMQQAAMAQGANQAQALVKANKTARTVVKAVQAAAGESVFTLITLGIQLNLEALNKWIFKANIPYIMEVDKDPNLDVSDVATGCFDVTCCFACLPMILFAFVFIFAIIYVADSDPIGILFEFIKTAFHGVFGG